MIYIITHIMYSTRSHSTHSQTTLKFKGVDRISSPRLFYYKRSYKRSYAHTTTSIPPPTTLLSSHFGWHTLTLAFSPDCICWLNVHYIYVLYLCIIYVLYMYYICTYICLIYVLYILYVLYVIYAHIYVLYMYYICECICVYMCTCIYMY